MVFFVYIDEARGRAGTMMLNGSGHNRTKGKAERGKTPTAESKAKTEGGGQSMGVGRNVGQERMHGVDKMDTEGNSQETKHGDEQLS